MSYSFFTRWLRDDEIALPVHTVKAKWGSMPCDTPYGRWKGYEPDWHVMVVRPDPKDHCYPFWVEGWLPGKGDGPCGEPFIWKVPSLNDPRYDLTEAVCIVKR